MSELLTVKEALSILRISPMTLHRLTSKGEGPRRVKIGGKSVRYRREDLEKWLESQIETQ